MKYRIADTLRSLAEFIEKERRFHWPHWAPWRQQVMMRWAVREHRRIHDSNPGLLMSRCKMRLMVSRSTRGMDAIFRDFSGMYSGAMGNTIEWKRLERPTSG